MTALIISASPEDNIEYIRTVYQSEKSPVVICADGGRYKAERLGIDIDWVVGDFDSSQNDIDGMKKLCLPKEKDWSDTEAAIQKAIELGADRMVLLGGLGGRVDHSLCNLFALLSPQLLEKDVCLMDACNKVIAIKKEMILTSDYKYMSIIPIDESLTGLTIRGVKYPLENAKVHRYKSLGLSNEIICERAELYVQEGKGLVVFSKDR